MTKTKELEPKPLLLRETYIHKGISIDVEIDFFKQEISLIDKQNDFKSKNWKFAHRGVEYMQGWQNILDAMKYATDKATKKLEDYIVKREVDLQNVINKAEKEILVGKLRK